MSRTTLLQERRMQTFQSELFISMAAKARPAPPPHRTALLRTPSSDPVLAAVTPNTGNGSISVFPAALSRHGGTRRHPPTECAEAADGATPRNSGHSTTSRALVSLGLIEGIVCEFISHPALK